MYKGLIFDLDGTLVNTLADIADSMNYVLAGFGFAVFDDESYRMKIGCGAYALAQSCLPQGREELTDELCDKWKKRYSENLCVKSKPYPGIIELVNELKRRRIPTALLTNKPQAAAEILVSTLLGNGIFKYVYGVLPDRPLKPDPTAALELAALMELEAREIVFVGDSAIDMQTARNAGMKAIGVEWGFRSRRELIDGGSDAVVSRPKEILEMMQIVL